MISLKRIMDIVGAIVALVVFAPLMILIAVAIALKMGFPVIFRQSRAGKDGEPFTIYKFRTMTNERDENGELLPDNQRITPLGSFLRKTTLDELPEFINVLKGDMSLVGPRPLRTEYVPRYSDFQRKRLRMRPGLTSLAVIEGRNVLDWDKRFALDVWYVENWNLFLDIKIIFGTIKLVLRREGVSHDGHATMPEFTGDANEHGKQTNHYNRRR